MKRCKLIAVDLAKSVFQVCIFNERGEVENNKQYTRKKFEEVMPQYQQITIVMEACYSANYFGLYLRVTAMKSSLFQQQHVKPFVRGNKNDANDAIAIGEAASRPNMTFVKVKRIEQQDVQSMHRIRERRVKVRTGLNNKIRGC